MHENDLKIQLIPYFYIKSLNCFKFYIMLTKNLHRILFFDIETASAAPNYTEMDADLQSLWDHKAGYWLKTEHDHKDPNVFADLYMKKAGIYAEFGKVVCISMGILRKDKNGIKELRLSSIYGTDEKTILSEFAQLINKYFNDPANDFLCGHNIKEFDVPYLSRRMIIHGISLPKMLDNAGKKPWETNHLIDTLELWKFGDYKNYTSLKLLAYVLGIPSPKDDIDGSMVSQVFWEEKNLDRIMEYCQKDVKTTVQVYLRLNGLPLVEEEKISFAGKKK